MGSCANTKELENEPIKINKPKQNNVDNIDKEKITNKVGKYKSVKELGNIL